MQLTLEIKQQTIEQERARLFNFIKGRVNNLEDAEDILQEVLFAFIDKYPLESAEKSVSWLFSVARNKIIDRYRKKKVITASIDAQFGEDNDEGVLMLRDILPDLGNDPDSTYLRNVIWDRIWTALHELPDEQRDIFIQQEIEGRSFRELAEEWGVSINTLLSRKRYAVIALREKLESLYNDL